MASGIPSNVTYNKFDEENPDPLNSYQSTSMPVPSAPVYQPTPAYRVTPPYMPPSSRNPFKETSDENIKKVQEALKANLDLAKENTTKVIERHDSLDILGQKANDLSDHGERYAIGARRLRKKYCWENYRTKLAWLVALAIIITVLSLIIWGITKK
jgi:hypothetical protein